MIMILYAIATRIARIQSDESAYMILVMIDFLLILIFAPPLLSYFL